MRHGTAGRRQRNNRSGGRRPGQQRNHVFDSNGPDVRIRGTAHQVAEKYEALAKDAAGAGDRIMAESYLQHAEHYLRIIASWDHEVVSDDTYSNHDEDTRLMSKARPQAQHGQHQHQNQQQQRRPQQDDLGLPSSILGAETQSSLEGV